MATERPFRHLSQADLDDMIKAEMMKGARATPPAVSGLTKSDYVSPEGRSGLMRTETPDETEWRNMQVEKRDIAKQGQIRGEYNTAMDAADKKFQESTAFNAKWGNQDRLERELQGVEQKLKSYQGILSGLRDITDYGDDTPAALQRQKFSILNALMGKGIDVGKVMPERKTEKSASVLGKDAQGRIWQSDKDGKLSVINPLKPDKPEKIQPNKVEEAQLKAAMEVLQMDPENMEAQMVFDTLVQKYGGVQRTPSAVEGLMGPKAGKGAATGKKVSKTGTDPRTGRKVVMYEDGTLSYAD